MHCLPITPFVALLHSEKKNSVLEYSLEIKGRSREARMIEMGKKSRKFVPSVPRSCHSKYTEENRRYQNGVGFGI